MGRLQVVCELLRLLPMPGPPVPCSVPHLDDTKVGEVVGGGAQQAVGAQHLGSQAHQAAGLLAQQQPGVAGVVKVLVTDLLHRLAVLASLACMQRPRERHLSMASARPGRLQRGWRHEAACRCPFAAEAHPPSMMQNPRRSRMTSRMRFAKLPPAVRPSQRPGSVSCSVAARAIDWLQHGTGAAHHRRQHPPTMTDTALRGAARAAQDELLRAGRLSVLQRRPRLLPAPPQKPSGTPSAPPPSPSSLTRLSSSTPDMVVVR